MEEVTKDTNLSAKPELTLKGDERVKLLFRHLGLSEKQARLYELLLTSGELRVSFLFRRSGIKRSTTYSLLADMKRAGLVQELEKAGIIFFRPEPPEKLTDLLEAKQKETDIAKSLVETLIPQLTSQYKASIGRPVVRYFEGKEGVLKVLEDVYAPGKSEVIGCLGTEEPDEEMYGQLIKRFMPLRIRRKIFARSLSPDSPRARELAKNANKQLKEKFLCDPQKYPLPAEIDVYEDKIAFLSFDNKDFVGLVIENKQFATTLRSVFTLLFDTLRNKGQGKALGEDQSAARRTA